MIDFPGAVEMDRAGTSDQREDIVRRSRISSCRRQDIVREADIVFL